MPIPQGVVLKTDRTVQVASLNITITDPNAAARQIADLATQGKVGHIHLVNAYTTVLANELHSLSELLERSLINYPDGKPLTWLGRIKNRELKQIRGPALFEKVFADDDGTRLRHFLLGSEEATLARLQMALKNLAPKANIVGVESPPFRALTPAEQSAQDERIRVSGANIVWVGLGTPKQDFEAARVSQATRTLAVAVGAAFDFSAGTKTRSPQWMNAIGLEWLHRLYAEPKRLWRRYLFGNSKFLVLSVKDILKRGVRS